MPLDRSERLTYQAVAAKLKEAIEARVRMQIDQAGAQRSWALQEESGELTAESIPHRDRALAGYRTSMERLRAAEAEWWDALEKTACGNSSNGR